MRAFLIQNFVLEGATPLTPLERPAVPQSTSARGGRCLAVVGRVRGGKLAPSATLSAFPPIFRPSAFSALVYVFFLLYRNYFFPPFGFSLRCRRLPSNAFVIFPMKWLFCPFSSSKLGSISLYCGISIIPNLDRAAFFK